MTVVEANGLRATVARVVTAIRDGATSAAQSVPVADELDPMGRDPWSDGYAAGWASAATLAGLTAADAIAELNNEP